MSRLHRLSVVAAALLLPWLIVAAAEIDTDSGRSADWLPEGSPYRDKYDRFVRQFGTDDHLIVSWPGCTLDNPCVERLAQALRNSPDAEGLMGRITTGPELIRELTQPPHRFSQDFALRRVEGILVGPDHQTTCLSIRAVGPAESRDQAFGLLSRTASDVCGLSRSDLRIAGSAYQTIALDEASSRTVRRFAVPAGLVSLVFAGLFLRHLQRTIALFAVSVFGQLMAMAVLDIALGRMNALLIVMPTLVYVLTMSGAVHLVNYCLDAGRDRGLVEGVSRGMRDGRTPCWLAGVTTAIGLLSLCVSQVRPVREFGLFAALCLMLALAALFLLLPGLLLWGVSDTSGAVRSRPTKFTRQISGPLNRVSGVVARHPAFVVWVSLPLVAVSACGLFRLHAVVDFDRRFRSDSEVIRNFEWLEEHLGPLVPIELLVEIPAGSPLTDLERVELVGRVERAIGQFPHVTGTWSAATFVPPRPETFRLRDLLERRLRAQRVSEWMPRFAEEGLLAVDGDRQQFRITFRLPLLGVWDYREFARSAEKVAQQVIAQESSELEEPITVSSTGLMPLTDVTNDQLFEDLARSYLLAFSLICPLMMVIVRGFGAGLLAMIPNLTPTLAVFGLMGWFGIPLDIGTVLCASVALGIAVDDTVHFLTWFGRGLSNGLSRVAAVQTACQRCGVAMIQTTLICGSGMLVFGLSEFLPASRFAFLLVALLVAALFGDLVILPALLCSPLGRIFERRRRQQTGAAGESVAPPLAGWPDVSSTDEEVSPSRSGG